MAAYLYILRCSDGSYYAGSRRGDLSERIAQHQAGTFDGYTACRLPVVLVFHQEFDSVEDAIAAERQVKGWRREKKEALIRGNLSVLPALSRRAAKRPERASRRAPGYAAGAPQHEETASMASSNVVRPDESA